MAPLDEAPMAPLERGIGATIEDINPSIGAPMSPPVDTVTSQDFIKFWGKFLLLFGIC
jgi:hypothetical protein